ncbi:SDR family NAD(P)-dependent oxidoreductase [Rhodococcus rhodochrous]|uniref:SDR family oxidoreductase n=1 Tax=Rhodococcus rhodochrous TaxID=1829 RepID=A0AA46WXD8_RHORH|nr:SDR family oxidoreductase [Rhodococcus rhodochrous]UZF45700.1 SDR family oxidoreductase [Rhodococcus rhodochrous]
MSGELNGKVAVVTGGASGIGRAVTEAFVDNGAVVVIGDIDDHHGSEVAETHPGSIVFRYADVTCESDMQELVAAAVDSFGRIDIMVNNAGALGDQRSVLDVDADSFTRTSDLLLRSVLLGHKHAGQRMKDQGTGGSIVSMSSIATTLAGIGSVSYSAVKAGIEQIARATCRELGRYAIRSNVIAPGVIITPILAQATRLGPERYAEFLERLTPRLGELHPLGRAGTARDIADAAVFLAGDRSGFVTGQTLTVDGGLTSVWAHDMAALVREILGTMTEG